MKYLILLVIVSALTACNPEPGMTGSEWMYQYDLKIRAERFDACMKALPAGPVSTHYNNWSEVVDSCEKASAQQSKRLAKKVNGEWVFQDGTFVK